MPSPSAIRSWAFTDAEWNGIGSASLKEGVSAEDAFALAFDATVRSVAMLVTMSGRQRGPEGTIPDEVELQFKAIVVREFFSRVPKTVSDRFFGTLREQAALRADGVLDRLSKTTGGIVAPDSPASEQPPSASVVSVGSCHDWDPNSTDGL